MRMPGWTSLTVLTIGWLFALLLAWMALAGQSGSPMPDNWRYLSRVLDVLEWSALASLILPVLIALSLSVARDRARLARIYGALLLLVAGFTVALSLWQLTRTP